MHTIKLQLSNYRFNSFHQTGFRNFTCFKLSEHDDEIEGICMTHEESKKLTDYIALNKVNFGYATDYNNCDPEVCPEMDVYDLLPIRSVHPNYIIIRRINNRPLNKSGDILSWMDVELLESNGTRKNLAALPFDLICELD